ncbi:MAG: electron transporter RnfD [Eubacteriales bacterium]|nr:electron transporter RnfD [Eubacteriales bacterium]MDD3882502.1 electron transporter RnfD [Eubacteriales bacterium]MDD4512802.1 electron transporter RnfD [Eubacteriales bacterium]
MRISAESGKIYYEGRIDFARKDAPTFIFAYSSAAIRFTGSAVYAYIENMHLWNDNYFGVIIDKAPLRVIQLSNDTAERRYCLCDNLSEGEHTLCLYKLQDSPHYMRFKGFEIEGGELLAPPEAPKRRMEFYGDSVTVGALSLATGCEASGDPMGDTGETCCAYWAYSAITARRLGASARLTSQGGIALLNGTGWYNEQEGFPGMEYLYNKLGYVKQLYESEWDFSLWTPQIVVVAIGQNDWRRAGQPDIDPNTDENHRKLWTSRYRELVLKLRSYYPKALFICSTTIMCHDSVWDDMIGEAVESINSRRVRHFMYSKNGSGTPGHIRAAEACKMAAELSEYIDNLPFDVWNN